MAKINTNQGTDVNRTAPLHMRIVIDAHQIDSDLWPSTLVNTVSEGMTPDEVLAELEDEFRISTVEGMITFLQEWGWFSREGNKWGIELEITSRKT